MKVLLLIFAVVYCTNGHALQKNNGLRPAKRAVTELGREQANSPTYSIHKSREISKSAYLPPAIRDLPRSTEHDSRQGITQLKPISTKLSSISQIQSSSAPSNRPIGQSLQNGFVPVSNAYGAPVNGEQQSQPRQQLQSQSQIQPDLQRSVEQQQQGQQPSPKRVPHSKYGIPPAFAQQEQKSQHQQLPILQQQPNIQVQQQSSANSNGYQSNVPNRNNGSPIRAQSQQLTQQQQSHQQQRTEVIFPDQQQSYQSQQINEQQNYQAPEHLQQSHDRVVGQVVSQSQEEYQAPGYLPPGQIVPQNLQQPSQEYEAPGYLPPSGSTVQHGEQIPELVSQQYNHEEIVPRPGLRSQNTQSGYSYPQNEQNVAPQAQKQEIQQNQQAQSGYAYQKIQEQIASQAINEQSQSRPQSGYGYQQNQEAILPEAIAPQTQPGYSYQHSNEEIAPQAIAHQPDLPQQGPSGYSYPQNQASSQPQQQHGYRLEQPSISAVASSQPVLPLASYPPNRAPYQHQEPISQSLNNPRLPTSYDPPPSGIPDGLIQPQDDDRTILREQESLQPYDQFQPVYRPGEYSEEGGAEGYDYSPPEQKFEDGQISAEPITKQIPNNQNYDVLSGSSLESTDFNIKEDFNLRQQQQLEQQQQPEQEQLHQQQQDQQQQQPYQQQIPESEHQQQQQQIHEQQRHQQQIQPELNGGAISGPVETIRIIDESNRNGQGRSIKTVQIYNEIIPSNIPGQSHSKTIKTIRVLNANSGIDDGSNSNNNGYLPPDNSIRPLDAIIESIGQEQEQQTNNGYLPPSSDELRPQAISDNGYLPPQQQAVPPEVPSIHQLLPPLPPINAPEPIEEIPILNSHSSIASSQPIRQETNNGYLPPPPVQFPNQEQQENNGYLPPSPPLQFPNQGQQENNGYLPPIENPPPSVLTVHQLLPPLPELPKSHSHNEILSSGEIQTNNGYLPPVHQHEQILATAAHPPQNNGQYQAPGYLPPLRETPPAPVPDHHEIVASVSPSQNGQYQAPGYLPPHSESIASSRPLTNNGYLPPSTNSIEPLASISQQTNSNGYLPPVNNNQVSLSLQQQQQQRSRKNNVKVLRIIHEKKQRPIQLPLPPQPPQQQPQSLPPQKLQQQQIIKGAPGQGSISDQQAIYAAAGQAVNSNVKTIRIIHERTANTPQGRYGNSKTYLPPSIRVIRVFRKK